MRVRVHVHTHMCIHVHIYTYVRLLQASLERIGVDSKGTVYWYDGGKNMFQSPPSNDPAYKPRYKSIIRVVHTCTQYLYG